MELNTNEVHLSQYWNVIYKRWKVAVSILVVVMLGTFVASYFSKPLYRSRAMLQIERENPNQLTLDDLFGIAASDQEFLQTQYVLLRSRGLAEKVIEDQKLLSDPDFYAPGITGKSKAQVDELKKSMAGALVGGIQVTPVRNTSLVEIAYVASSPKLAQKITEGIGDSFMRMNAEKKVDAMRQANEFLTRQIGQLKAELDVAREELQRYSESRDLINIDDANNITVQRLIQVNTDLTNAQAERIEKQSRYDTLLRSSPDSVAGSDPLVLQMTEEVARAERDYAQKSSAFRPEHPEMVRLRGQIEKTRQARQSALREAFAKLRDNARSELQAAQQRESSMRAALDDQKRETLKLNVNAVRYTDLRAGIASKETLVETLTRRLNETEVTSRIRGSSNIHWVEHADFNPNRFNVTMRKNLQTAFPLGIILGLAAIFFLEYMDRSIKSPEELEKTTKLASLGVIPAAGSIKGEYGYHYSTSYGRGEAKLRPVEAAASDASGQGIDLLPHYDSRSPISESYRAFRTSLLLASANSPKVIVITSTFAREGKTTTSINLATVLAQMGKPVLLVDADLRRPRLQKVFRGKMNLGLVNYLAANIPIEDVVQETAVPNLSVVLSGPTPPNPSELLASDRMKHLIEEVRARFAYVIFDSPPVMVVTDSIVLAASADGVVLCVHGGQTPRELVQRAAERLRQSNIPILGAILNNLDLQQYGYTYKKSYYDYYDSAEPENEPARKNA